MAKSKSTKSFEEQYDDEEMLLLFRKHPVVMRKHLIVASFVILAGTIPSFIKPEPKYFFWGVGVGFAMSFVVMFFAWVSWHYSVFIVTSKRFIQITQAGLFDRAVVDIALDQIQMVNYHIRGLQETLLGFGTLNIQTMVGELTIHEVHKPAKVQRELSLIIREHVHGEINAKE
ncbi:PH domain-containing protein [Candidatus Saccharibacteria bacterium]|nr:PH domain-containing protein [Candidatus Saccharibacteria bacterium]MCB9821244.1 PH domain-containing protein [Candidatus Nomurabacteria bacterium]